MFNKVVLVGRISTDLELKQTSNGKPYCRFNLAVNRMKEGTDFIPVTVWNGQAENLTQYQSKGSQILIEGSISMNNYTDKDGNNRTSFEIMAQNVQYLGAKLKTAEEPSEKPTNDLYEEFGEQVNIDDNFLDW